jgi:hypothetical protein
VIPDNLATKRHLVFVENVLPGLLEDVRLAVSHRLWFQHDGAPWGSVRQWLNTTYPGRWIDWTGDSGQVAWPPLSPGLATVFRITLRGDLKQRIYVVPHRIINYLAARLQAAETAAYADMLRCVRRGFRAAYFGLSGNGQRLLRKRIVNTGH